MDRDKIAEEIIEIFLEIIRSGTNNLLKPIYQFINSVPPLMGKPYVPHMIKS